MTPDEAREFLATFFQPQDTGGIEVWYLVIDPEQCAVSTGDAGKGTWKIRRMTREEYDLCISYLGPDPGISVHGLHDGNDPQPLAIVMDLRLKHRRVKPLANE